MLTLTLKDQARRFTTLIDNFYDNKVSIYLGFEALKTSVATTLCAVLFSVDALFYYQFVINKALQ